MRIVILYDLYAKQIIAALAATAGLSVFLYGALLLGAVAHTAGRTTTEKSLYAISAKVGVLENTYLLKNKAINLERARTLGFVQPQKISTVYIGSGSLTLGTIPASDSLR